MTTELHPPALINGTLIKPELAGDMLRGAAEIAGFLYGDPGRRRKIYHLAANTQFPCFKIGSQLHARRSVLLKWIADQESRGLHLTEFEGAHS